MMRILFLVLFFDLQLISSLSTTQSHNADSDMMDYRNITHNATDFTPDNEYDYIVIGGGTAGCPLAATLSRNYSVLLLERGGTPYEHPEVLRQGSSLLIEANDKDSPAEVFLSEDKVPNARGRILGGSSMINSGFYSRANDDFYAVSGIDWDMNLVDESYKWVEETVAYRPKNLTSWQLSFRNALLESGVLPYYGYTLDHKVGTKISASIFDDQGWRHGSVEHLNRANPENLQVVIHAITDRILFSNSSAVGVIYHDSNGKSYKAKVREHGEVISSAGALGSPQLLLLSGVGPKEMLSFLDIPTVNDQPFVGKFMVDNPQNSVYLDSPVFDKDEPTKVVGVTENSTYLEAISGDLPFDTKYGFSYFYGSSPPLNISMVGIVTKFAKPRSVGFLKLVSATNISILPIVRFNYFAEPEDLISCANGMRKLQDMLKTKAMKKYLFANIYKKKFYRFLGPALPMNQSDYATLAEYCRKTLSSFWHFHGGCLPGKVVDSRLRVKSIKGLRVVDASVFTMSPGTNPQATIMMLGRYIGLSIEKERAIKGPNHIH